MPLPRRRRSVVSRRSSSTARSAGSTASRYERYMSRRHVAQGRCPAASATASSRKKIGVQRLGRASGTRQSRNSVKQVIHSVELRWWRTTCSRSSTMQPRLPVNRPRALTACRSPHGSTRLRRGITPSCQPFRKRCRAGSRVAGIRSAGCSPFLDHFLAVTFRRLRSPPCSAVDQDARRTRKTDTECAGNS